jgi:hypothetical protein
MMKNLMSVFMTFFLTMGLYAQTAEEIVSKYVENTGGKDAWSAISSMKATGTIKAQGMEFPAVMLTKNNKQKVSFTFQGMTIVQPAFDGETGWQTNFMNMKAEKMEAEDNEIAKAEAEDFPNPFLSYKEKGYTVELQGTETVEGTDCFKVKFTKKPVKIEGKEEENSSVYFFDKENFVPLVVRSTVKKGPAKGKFVETVLSDYQEVSGVMMPFSMDNKFDGQTQASILIQKIEANVPIDDNEFAFPADN